MSSSEELRTALTERLPSPENMDLALRISYIDDLEAMVADAVAFNLLKNGEEDEESQRLIKELRIEVWAWVGLWWRILSNTEWRKLFSDGTRPTQ